MGYLEDFEKNARIQKEKLQKEMDLEKAKEEGAKDKEIEMKKEQEN